MIKINKNSWHFKYYHWLKEYNYDYYNESYTFICGYVQYIFWMTLWMILSSPLVLIGYITEPIFKKIDSHFPLESKTHTGFLTVLILFLINSAITTGYINYNVFKIIHENHISIEYYFSVVKTFINGNGYLALNFMFGCGIVGLFLVLSIIYIIIRLSTKICHQIEFYE